MIPVIIMEDFNIEVGYFYIIYNNALLHMWAHMFCLWSPKFCQTNVVKQKAQYFPKELWSIKYIKYLETVLK